MEGKEKFNSVCVTAVLLYMNSLGYSSMFDLVCAGLLTLVALEAHVLAQAVQECLTKIEGYDFSGIIEHVSWWSPSPTIIRSHDREAVHIPNHKFTDNVVRNNLTQKSHWHIKSYIAINPLDVNKITSILADMRKVLAKNPLVEQQKLHGRVFLKDINPENQALKILISCFVKTSHYEEYLCAKEAILLDLLRVVSHHQAQLATPIRTVDEPAAFDSKTPPCVNSKDKSKSNSDSQSVVSETSPITSHEFGRGETASATSSQSKQDEEKSLVLSSSVWPPLEENIVLGVALEDSKQTLPSEEWHLI